MSEEIWNDSEFMAWFNQRPEHIQKLVKKYPPGYYTMKDSSPDVHYQLLAYDENEDGTVTARVYTEGGIIPFSREVFGVNFESLELIK